MKEPVVPSSEAIVPARDYQLPRQPKTVGNLFNWNHQDLAEAKKMKIKI
jgi:hypothetical protein